MDSSRRSFLGTTAALAAQTPARAFAANDQIQIATIGCGGMGSADTRMATSLPGVRLVAASDIYDGRRERAREVWGKDLFTTRDYREVLARKDVDAVIIATPDHWHSRITIDALKAGKDVYCEKPMVQKVEQGRQVVDAEKASGRILQVGSQYVSSILYRKTLELLRAGAIGSLSMVEAWLDRNTSLGAWGYSIPPDASPDNIDWDRFLGDAPKRAFEPVRLFRWRNYRDYGTGIPGDLFVHLLSGLHVATGAVGPNRIFATGGLSYWKDGRDVADMMLALLDYPASEHHPAFTFALRVNLKAGSDGEHSGLRFVGSEGVINLGKTLVLTKTPPEREPGYTVSTFPTAVQEAYLREYRKKYPVEPATADGIRPATESRFDPPPGYNAHLEHHKNFFAGVRSRKAVVEDATFGFRAAGPALLCNTSYFDRRVCGWDAERMTVIT